MVTLITRFRHTALISIVCLGLALLAGAAVSAATLTATIDRTQLALDETLTLTLRYDSQGANGEPEMGALEPFFEILGRSQSRQLRIINGQRESFTQWQFTLAPKTQGRILVPAFELNGARSQPFEVMVTEPSVSMNSHDADYFMVQVVEPETAYIGQQVRLRVQVNTAVTLSEMQITAPQVDGAKLQELEDRQYQRSVNGRPYLVYEKNYSLIPEQAGLLELPALRLAAVAGANRSLFDLNRGQRVRLRTEPLQIEIKPLPADAGSDWLPANRIKLEQWLETGITTVHAGEPITLNLRLSAQGADPARLPALRLPSLDGVKTYPEPVEEKQHATADSIEITRSRRIGLVPTTPGKLVLPPATIRWWNSQDSRYELAQSDTITLTVLPPRNTTAAAGQSRTPDILNQPDNALPAPRATAPTADNTVPAPINMTQAPDNSWLLWSHLIWAVLCAVLALGWWRAKRQPPAAPSEATNIAAAAPDYRAVEQQLRAACNARNPAATRQALLAYAQARQLITSPVSLSALHSLAGDELRAQLEQLDKALYAPAVNSVDYDRLLRLMQSLKPAPAENKEGSALKPLYG